MHNRRGVIMRAKSMGSIATQWKWMIYAHDVWTRSIWREKKKSDSWPIRRICFFSLSLLISIFSNLHVLLGIGSEIISRQFTAISCHRNSFCLEQRRSTVKSFVSNKIYHIVWSPVSACIEDEKRSKRLIFRYFILSWCLALFFLTLG